MRPLGTKHPVNLNGFERHVQKLPVVGIITRQRHRQIIAQPAVHKVVFRQPLFGKVKFLPPLEDFENHRQVFAAIAFVQALDILHRRRSDFLKSVLFIGVGDFALDIVAEFRLVRQKILGASDRLCVDFHSVANPLVVN